MEVILYSLDFYKFVCTQEFLMKYLRRKNEYASYAPQTLYSINDVAI